MSKQYLLMVDDLTMAMIGRLAAGIKFLPVEGMGIKGNEEYNMLVSPVLKVPVIPTEECENDPGPVEQFNIPETQDAPQA